MNWSAVALDQLCEINVGRTPSRDRKDYWNKPEHAWASIGDMSQSRSLEVTKEAFSEKARRECNMKLVPAGTVLFSFKLSIGKVSIAARDLFTNEAIAALPVLDPSNLDTEYLARALEFLNFSDAGNRAVMGKTLNKAALKQIKIPLPPIAEQRRIAAILDQADALRRLRRQTLAHMIRLDQAIFFDMFGDLKCNSKGFNTKNLGEISQFYSGNSLPAGEDFVGQSNGHLLLKVSDLNHYENHRDIVRAASWSAAPGSRAGTCPPNSIIFPKRGGAIATNKKRRLTRSAILDPNLMGVHPDPALVTLEFIFGWLATFNLIDISSGSSVPQLNKQDLAPLTLPIPPIDLQHEYRNRLSELESIRFTQLEALNISENLFTSLQHRAFRGEL